MVGALLPLQAYGAYGMVPVAAAYQQGAQGGAAGGPGSSGAQPSVYDPNAPIDVDKVNATYVFRQMPMLTASFMRMM